MSFQRARLSAERMLMSVIRTSLSLIGFGFTIFQFFEKLKQSGDARCWRARSTLEKGSDMLRLADTTVRLYRKRDGRASYHLRSYLLVDANAGFRLSAYLKSISCRLTWTSGDIVQFDDIGFTEDVILKYELNTLVHRFHATAFGEMPRRQNGLGTLRLDYHVSFTGHPSEEAKWFEVVVPIVGRGRMLE